jgi:predicted metal-dependent hydrolase
MIHKLELDEITIEIAKKKIKYLHLKVSPPWGRVRLSAPLWMKLETIRLFALSKLGWIKQKQKKMRDKEQRSPSQLHYMDNENHWVWGKSYLLKIIEENKPPRVELDLNQLNLCVRPSTSTLKKQALIENWYREEMKQTLPSLIMKWEAIIGVKAKSFCIQKMKTRWGSCNTVSKNIRFNLELAKKPLECLEYVVVHELVHLKEPSHNSRFKALMDQFMPHWRFHKTQL